MLWCFLGDLGDQKGQNLRYILILRVAGLPLWLSIGGGGRVHWVQVVQGAGAFVVLSWCVPSLCPCLSSLCCFGSPAIVLYYALFRVLRGFLAGFGVRMYICMGLVLCVDCGAFCAREGLGGFGACCVSASVFLLLLLCLPFFLSFSLSFCCCCPLLVFTLFVGCSWVSFWFVVSFSLTDYTPKRKGAPFGASSLGVLLFPLLFFGFNP